jgi:drug/metabolite transporter (DMT)-like permease
MRQNPVPSPTVTDPTPSRDLTRRVLVTGAGTRTEAYGGVDWVLLGGTSLIWGASFLFIAEGLESIAPGTIAWARLVLGVGALGLLPAARRPIPHGDWPRIAAVALAGVGMPALLFALAEQWVSSAVAGMLVSATPLATVLIGVGITRSLPSRPQRWGVLVGLLGVVMLSTPDVTGANASVLGIVLVLVAVFGYGFANQLYPPLTQRHGALATMFWAQLAAAAVLTPLGVAGLPRSSFSWVPVLSVVALGVLGTGWARVMHLTLVGRVGANRGTIAGYLIPVVALVLGVMVRGEAVEPVQLLGVVVAVSGGWLLSRREPG